MEKRIFIAVILSIALLWGWAVVAPKLFPELAKPRKPAPVQTTPAPSTTTTAAAPQTQSQTQVQQQPATPPVRVAPIPRAPVGATQIAYTVIQRPGFVARFSNRGAELVSFQLTGYKTKDGKANVELVKGRDPSRSDFPFAIEARDGAFAARLNTAFYAINRYDEKGATVLEYRYAGADGVAATKTFRFRADYLFDFSVAVSAATTYRIAV